MNIRNYNGIKRDIKKDKYSTFIFSFNNGEKYLPRNGNDSMYCVFDYGSVFGCSLTDIALEANSFDKSQCYKSKSNTFLSDRILTNIEEYLNKGI